MPVPNAMYLSPWGQQQFLDDNGDLLVGGLLFCYAGGTSDTKQAAFTDSTGDTALPNPIVLNARGSVAPSATGTSCGLWIDPTLSYKFVLAPADDTDPPTATIETIDNVLSAQASVLAALAEYMASLGGIQIGTMVSYGGTTAPPGWLLCYGQAVSRATYAQLFARIGTAYGAGDTSTTFNVPDKRGRVSVGKDNMGGSAANRVTNAVSGITATTLGASGGDQHAQEDMLSASSTAISAVSDPGHLHTFFERTIGGSAANNIPNAVVGGPAPDGQTAGAYTGVSVTTTVTTDVTSTLEGASQNMPPCEIDNIIIFAGV